MTISKKRVYNFPIEAVWAAITEPDLLSNWFMQADFKAEEGYQFRFQDTPRGSWDGVLTGEVLHVVQQRELSYTWRGNQMKNSTEVAWTLESENGQTAVTLTHSGFRGFNDGVIGLFHKFGWAKFFNQLNDFLERDYAGKTA